MASFTASDRSFLLSSLVVFFDAAPSKPILNDLAKNVLDFQGSSRDAVDSLLTNFGRNSDLFLVKYGAFQTPEEFAETLLEIVGITSGDAFTIGRDALVALVPNNTIEEKVDAMLAAVDFLTATPVPDARFADAAATLANKTAVSLYYSQNVTFKLGEVDLDDLQQVLVSVGSTQASVDAAIARIDAAASTFALTAGTDDLVGTSANDIFEADLSQNTAAGGVSNTLSTADSIDGGNGIDTLIATLVQEFIGSASFGNNSTNIDVTPSTVSVENIEIEVADFNNGNNQGSLSATLDAKDMLGVQRIGSHFSDGDLVVENLTTLTNTGLFEDARNTDSLTVVMDHTDNTNTDGDASDLKVLLDDDYLLAGRTAQSQAFYFLLDENAEEQGLANRLANINIDGIRFTLGSDPTVISINDAAARTAGTHEGFVAALQAPLAALIASGVLPQGTTLTLNPAITDFTFLDNGQRSNDIPAIVLTSGDGTTITPVGFSQVADALGNFDVYGDFNATAQVDQNPVTINIELEKVGRAGDGGDLIVGAKSLADGIEVFRMTVLEDADRPNSLGTIASTGNTLRQVIITSDNGGAADFASLTVRDGFRNFTGNTVTNGVITSSFANIDATGDLQLIDAAAFRGDLIIGTSEAQADLDTGVFTGGGNNAFNGVLTGNEENQQYAYTFGAGNDTSTITINGDATDYAQSGLTMSMGDGNDRVNLVFANDDGQNEPQNQYIIDNVDVNLGAGNDVYTSTGEAAARSTIIAGAGDDIIYSGNTPDGATQPTKVWQMNHATASLDDPLGLPLQTAYLGGATVTVTLSGAGNAGGSLASGGGNMSGSGAAATTNGFESAQVIGSLINGNTFFGDERDVNAAIIAAITQNAVLNAALSVAITENNTLTITSRVPGAFEDSDLQVTITQATIANGSATATALENEAKVVFADSDITFDNLFDIGVPASSFYDGGVVTGANVLVTPGLDANNRPQISDSNAFFTGSGTASPTEVRAGTIDGFEDDSIIAPEGGNDIIFLSTLSDAGAAVTLAAANAAPNGSSNQVVDLNGSFGTVAVMNFLDATTAGANSDGNDFLGLGSYLTSTADVSDGTGTGSNNLVSITFDQTLNAVGMVANEVAVITITPTATNTFDGLTETVIENLFNNVAGTTFAGLGVNDLTVSDNGNNLATVGGGLGANGTLVGDAAKAVLLVQNDSNDGVYKLFELSWTADNDATTTNVVDATLRGTIDLGSTAAFSLNDFVLV